MNILRDPPKSVMTRRIDKVGETSSITEMIDQSGNRACEAISLYARGVNPMVSVSYGNAGNNGGQRAGNACGTASVGGAGRQAYLPYRIARDGAFRPPVIRQEQLLPLSRQPRTNTQAFTKRGFVDFSKSTLCSNEKNRCVKKTPIHIKVRPTATYRIDQPLSEPGEVKYMIKDATAYDTHAGVTGKRVRYQPTQTADTSTLHSERYLQNPLHADVQAKKSQNIQITPIEDVMDVDIRVKDAINVQYTAPKSGYTKNDRNHKNLELQRRVLAATMATNKQRNIYVRPQVEHQAEQKRNRPMARGATNHGVAGRQSMESMHALNNREYRLAPKISAGGFDGRATVPRAGPSQSTSMPIVESERARMSRRVLEMQHTRVLR